LLGYGGLSFPFTLFLELVRPFGVAELGVRLFMKYLVALILAIPLLGCVKLFPEADGVSYFGDEARKKIDQSEISIPAHAKDPFYYIDGFVDHTEFISFIVSPAEAESVVERYAHVKFDKFVPWKNQIPLYSGCREPGYHNKNNETPLYDVDVLKDAIIYIDNSKEREGYHFIYDRATHRLYFCSWDS
jgi:hypothetical protein